MVQGAEIYQQYLSNNKSTVSGTKGCLIPIKVNQMSVSSQVQKANTVTPPPLITLTLDGQCVHGVRVCDDCRNQPNGESEVHDELSSDMNRWGLW